MRKQSHSIPPVLERNSRLNDSVVLHRKHKRPNAQRHGVFAEPLILPGEDPREFEALHSALIEEWTPSGPSEESRVFGIADAEWRKLRSRRFVQGKAIGNSLRADHPAFDETRGLIAFGYLICREPETAFEEYASKYLCDDKIRHLDQKFPREYFESIEEWAVAVARTIYFRSHSDFLLDSASRCFASPALFLTAIFFDPTHLIADQANAKHA